ncbi:hypothetical protein TD95_000922 [Thielaviopsis punctulata]|uniref:Methyltransferase domain-containing protein n=1 Tax=Thielaviopsis punctulata TaxID=72032 RepID=A0A0F4ZEL9_9PEZI|nr:hypothetical protein TD95_000922 [Thielaviopsis punctulata]
MPAPPVSESFKDLSFQHHNSRWDQLWKEQSTPWDRSTPSPALFEALELPRFSSSSASASASAPARRKRALVPGCGRGYDVLLLASFGYDAVGLDTSDTAIRAAEEHARDSAARPEYALKDGVRERGSVRWVVADFFAPDLVHVLGGPFDLVYDYTFLCALPVSMRPRWAAQMAALLSAAGALICLEFPVGKPPAASGPPHGLQSSAYMALLSAPGAEVEYDEAGDAVRQVATAENGLVRVEYFKPKKTHAVGYAEDGSITDNVSVWQHAQ